MTIFNLILLLLLFNLYLSRVARQVDSRCSWTHKQQICSGIVQVHGSRIEVIPGDYYGNNVHLSKRCSLKTRDNFSVFVSSLSTACARRLFLTFLFSLSTSVWPFYFYFPPYLPSLSGISSVILTVFTPFPSELPSVIHLLALALSLPLSIFSSIYRSGS